MFTLFVIGVIDMFLNSSKRYRQEQDEYFSNKNYFISGEIIEKSCLGGLTFLLTIKVDSILLSKNEPCSKYFVGTYNEKLQIVHLLANGPAWLFSDVSDIPSEIVTVEVVSDERKITYCRHRDVSDIRFSVSSIYQNRLRRCQSPDEIRF